MIDFIKRLKTEEELPGFWPKHIGNGGSFTPWYRKHWHSTDLLIVEGSGLMNLVWDIISNSFKHQGCHEVGEGGKAIGIDLGVVAPRKFKVDCPTDHLKGREGDLGAQSGKRPPLGFGSGDVHRHEIKLHCPQRAWSLLKILSLHLCLTHVLTLTPKNKLFSISKR